MTAGPRGFAMAEVEGEPAVESEMPNLLFETAPERCNVLRRPAARRPAAAMPENSVDPAGYSCLGGASSHVQGNVVC